MNLVFPKDLEGYFVPKERLLSLIKAEQKLIALNYGGVDNWEYYSEAIGDHIREYCYDHEDFANRLGEDVTLDDIAEDILEEIYAG